MCLTALFIFAYVYYFIVVLQIYHKIPNNQNPLDKLVKYIKEINEDTIKYTILYRIINDESHVHPEILFDKSYLINAVSLLLDTIKTYDKLHYETLIESCNIVL